MDRYIIREARAAANYPQGNQMMAFSTTAGRNNMVPPETVYYGGTHANQFGNMQHVTNPNFVDIGMNTPMYAQTMLPAQGQMVTGIDPRYLANYSDNSAQYIVTGHPTQGETGQSSDPGFGSNYKQLNFGAPDKNKSNMFIPPMTRNGQPVRSEPGHMSNDPSFGFNYENRSLTGAEKNKPKTFTPQVVRNETPKNMITFDGRVNTPFQPKQNLQEEQLQQSPMNELSSKEKLRDTWQETRFNSPNGLSSKSLSYHVTTNKVTETNAAKKEHQIQGKSRADRLQALHKSGPRAISGPVEKVLKWHKALQDIGVFVFYEIVAKCVSVRAGERWSKNLVIRDDNGPAMQVVYYEIDFLLPELKVPSTVRVIGRMMTGTCRLQAFSVRPATGDDVATLPRRAAVAAHHVARLCKDYGVNV